jgi:general secretion pathway protein D
MKDVVTQQLTIEAQIIEVSDSTYNLLAPTLQAQLGTNSKVGLALGGSNGLQSSFEKAYGSPVPRTTDLTASLNLLRQKRKLKVIANPSIIATHNEESVLNVVEEVVQGFQTVTSGSGGTVANIPNIVNAGIMLNILPKVGVNGDVSLRVNPIISWPQPSPVNNNITLISRRELITEQVIIPEGHSFVLAGLTQQMDSQTMNKLPGLSDIPLFGALMRSSSGNKSKTELLIILTPHIHKP